MRRAALESLPPDQRAVLQLILKQGRGYTELSGLLKIDEDAVRARAHAGLEALVPNGAGAALTPTRRAQIADYLLSQQDDSDRSITLQHLEDSRAARRWASALRDQLAPLAAEDLPEVPGTPSAAHQAAQATDEPVPADGTADRAPADGATADDEPVAAELAQPTSAFPAVPVDAPVEEPHSLAPEEPVDDPRADAAQDEAHSGSAAAPRPSPPSTTIRAREWQDAPRRSSKLGGILLLGGVAALIAVVVIVLVNRGGDDQPTASAPAAQAQTSRSATRGATPGGGASSDAPTVLQQVNLNPPGGADSAPARGVAFVMIQGQRPVVAVQVADIPPNGDSDVYAAFLHSSRTGRSHFLGYVPGLVKRDRRFTVSSPLPNDTASYDEVVVSRESSQATAPPGSPSDVVLSGRLRVNRAG
ncbi:MAG TPA: sigma factor-like helix-turn-helix DNA-binding protein [Conexibacter sp.]|jgi:hypothetical protein